MLFLILLISLANALNLEPRILVHNGNFMFDVAENKNIRIETKGSGAVIINGVDVSKTSQLTSAALEKLKTYQANFDDSFKQVERFNSMMDDDLFQKISTIKSFSNTTLTSSLVPLVQEISTMVNSLETQFNNLNILISRDDCLNNPCQNGGTCQDLFDDYFCTCPPEWHGPRCNNDVNECDIFTGTDLGCQNGATCINKPGTYSCICPLGWFGTHCTKNSNKCLKDNIDLCRHGTCLQTLNGYTCLCDQGWTTDGRNPACTIDVNECKMKKYPCSVNPPVGCINLPGSFACGNCPSGYTGNGYDCTDINECTKDNGGCSTTPLVQCTNTVGSRICGSCPAGYSGNGIHCYYEGVCNINNGNCHQLATCTQNSKISSTFVQCTCPVGYIGNGIGPNGCVPKEVTACSPNPCLHGNCILNGTNYTCNCMVGYTGENCNLYTDMCRYKLCKNGATCSSIPDLRTYKCICPSTHKGTHCETERYRCGQTMKEESGVLAYPPQYQQFSHLNFECCWFIETGTDKILNITFTRFNLDQKIACTNNFLQIQEKGPDSTKTLGVFCGSKLPNNGTIISSYHIVRLCYMSASVSTTYGFNLTWSAIPRFCGDEAKTDVTNGTISSGGWPKGYPYNRDCYWPLLAPPGQRLAFNISLVRNTSTCVNNYLEFIDGTRHFGSIVSKYCNASNDILYSPSNKVLIHINLGPFKTEFNIKYSVIDGCGGVFSANQQELKSPSDPYGYNSFIECQYKIYLPEGTNIKLTFLSIFQTNDCFTNAITIFNGLTIGSPPIKTICRNELPPPYTINSNVVFIIFTSLEYNNLSRFHLKYETVCSKTFTTPNGVIHMPTQIGTRVECIYEIVQPLGTIIELKITDLDLEWQEGCKVDYVEVRDGHNQNMTLMGKYCTKPPNLLISSYNHVWIKLNGHLKTHGTGFRANYTSRQLACGGILRQNSGTFSSPQYPDVYPHTTTCSWIIFAPLGNVIEISWMNFRLEKSFECVYDFVQLFDNNTVTGVDLPMGRFCGTVIPPVLISTSNLVTIVYRTDALLTIGYFMGSYVFVSEKTACGGNYYTEAGTIKTPGYPDVYPRNTDCIWTISGQPGHQIMLNVIDFNLGSASCKNDYLEIRNGITRSSPLIGVFCGSKIPKLIPSHHNQMYLKFVSDMSGSFRGFNITWTSTATGCGGTLNSPSGSIISPNYPETYTISTECFWKIYVNAGSRILLSFTDLDLSEREPCFSNYIEAFDGVKMTSKSLGRFCADVPFDLLSTTNRITIKFRSDATENGRGFHLQYRTVCNNTLNNENGVIESPNFPNSYPNFMDCYWDIKVDSAIRINMTFFEFDLGASTDSSLSNCTSNFVEILYMLNKGDEDYEPFYFNYGKYCRSNTPSPISLKSKNVQVHFQSDRYLNGKGFRLEYQTISCNEILTNPTGTITLPNYPYRPFSNCTWKIQVDYGNHIEITFLKLKLQMEDDLDRAILYNGEDDSYPEIASLYYLHQPITFQSSGNMMFLKLPTELPYVHKEFYANYSSKPSKCGGKYTTEEGTFMSPNYPKNYDVNDTCGFEIEVAEGYMIVLTFKDFDLYNEKNLSCIENNSSYVKVYDGPTIRDPLLGKLCGKTTRNFTSTTNKLYVEMVTKSTQTAKGFLVNYKKTCGARIITEGTGNIMHNRHHLDSCSWTIIAKDSTNHISLTISQIEIQYCSIHAVVIYNGDSSSAPLLGTFCDEIPPTITSDGSAMHITIAKAIDFFATYSIYDSHCGGTLKFQHGTFTSPGYPKRYPMNVECEWKLEIPEGNYQLINFISFSLPQSESCNTDYLEVRAGNATGKLLGTFCGNNPPQNIRNLGNIWVFLKTSSLEGSEITAKGFEAYYSLSTKNILTGPSGRIVSPLLDADAHSFRFFSWQITVDFGKRILLTFEELFTNLYIFDCLDKIMVYDGENNQAPVLHEYCGDERPNVIESSSNNLLIELHIYVSTIHFKYYNYRFILKWTELNVGGPNGNITGCGQSEPIMLSNSNASAIYLTSPGYPNGYADDLVCEWIFQTVPMNTICFTFLDLDLPATYGEPCYLDYVEFFVLKSGNWHSWKKQCKKETLLHVSPTNMLKVVFKTNSLSNEGGFSAVVREACGGSMTGSSGYIMFNNTTKKRYRQQYRIKCRWHIEVSFLKGIKFELLNVTIPQAKEKKCFNHLTISTHSICADSNTTTVEVNFNEVLVEFEGLFETSNFLIYYKEVSHECGGNVILNEFEKSVTITSRHTCTWQVMAPPGEIIRIDFTKKFYMTSVDQLDPCKDEYIELRDGGTIYSRKIGTFCGYEPKSVFSTDNMLFVKFFSQLPADSIKFEATVSLTNCGGTVHGKSGQIQYPHFNNPNEYTGNVNCTWHISTPENHNMEIRFNMLNIASTSNCSDSNRLWIYEATSNRTAIRTLGRFCGNNLPTSIKSSDNKVIVNFITNSQKGNYTGFSLSFNASETTCGGTIEARSGTILSPEYSNKYMSKRTCKWYIKVPKGRRITAKFTNVDITNIFENIQLFNADDEGYIKSIRYSVEDIQFDSSENHLVVVYNKIGSGHGFKLQFTSDKPTDCIGDLNDDEGSINKLVIDTFYCTYECNELPSGNTLAINISIHYNEFDSVKAIFESDNMDHPLKVIENHKKATIISSLHHVKIRIFTALYHPLEEVGYSIHYKRYPCGGNLADEIGTIKTPGYPNKYQNPLYCNWLIKMQKEQTIVLNFIDFNIGSDCSKSFVEIYNGNSPSSPKIGKFCGTKPETIHSEGNSLWIDYTYTPDQNSTGFSLKYEPHVHGCRGIFHNDNRVVQSPAFPGDYPNNVTCLWELRSDEGYTIGLTFISRFQIEESQNCEKDFLEILDWKDENWVSLGRKCGREITKTVNSTSHSLRVLFKTNEQIQGKGFKATWEWNCGGTLVATRTEQFIEIPKVHNVSKNFVCRYSFTAKSPSHYTNLKYYHNSFCIDNLISIFQKISRKTLPIILKQELCEFSPIRLRGSFDIIFEMKPGSIQIESLMDFKFSYQTDECGGIISSPTIIDDLMPKEDPYSAIADFATCSWNITAPMKKNIRFRIFDELNSNYCGDNHIEIFESSSVSLQRRIAKLCSNLNNFVVKTKTNIALLQVHNKGLARFSNIGFKVEIDFIDGPDAGCGGEIFVNDTTTLTAPDLPNMDCSWQFRTKIDSRLALNINKLSLPRTCGLRDNYCQCAKLEIKDGHPDLGESIDTLCGLNTYNFEREFFSTRNTLGLRLHTKGNYSEAFEITIKAIPSVCGNLNLQATDTIQTLTSPEWPRKTPNNIKCAWKISGKDVLLRFVEFDISQTNVCAQDHLQIIDGTFSANDYYDEKVILSNNVEKLCGNTTKPPEKVFNSDFVLKYSSGSNAKVRGKGFKVEYHLLHCNRNYTDLYGPIKHTSTSGDCYYLITVPQNYTISIFFLDLVAYSSDNCSNLGFEIRDGKDKSAPLFLKTCSYALPIPLFSTTNQIWIHTWQKPDPNYFVTFDLIYIATDQGRGCGGKFHTSDRGIISSPLYPNPYKSNKECVWEVTVPTDMIAIIKFNDFNTNGVLQVITQYNSQSKFFHTINADNLPDKLYGGVHFFIKYNSSIHNKGRGWMLEFHAEKYQRDSFYIISPEYS